MRRLGPFVLVAALLLSTCTTLVLPARAPALPGLPQRPGRLLPSVAPRPPAVTVDPASWWLETGASVVLRASWVGIPPACRLLPAWFRWSIASNGSEGDLNATAGAAVAFLASGAETGTTAVATEAAATLDCAGGSVAVTARGVANVSVEAPVALGALRGGPDPVGTGVPVTLTGTVGGGTPPYDLGVDWGDGSTEAENLSAPGPFALVHAFETNGSFSPRVTATDANGGIARATAPEPINVSGAFAAAIAASVPVAEVGVPVTFRVSTTDAPRSFGSLFACENATLSGAENSSGLLFGCTFREPGVAPVWFEAVGGSNPFPVATARLDEPVETGPSVAIAPGVRPGEAGRPWEVPIELAGGVLPLAVRWATVGGAGSGVVPDLDDGRAYLSLLADRPGAIVLTVSVVDALGVSGTPVSATVDVRAEPLVEAAALATPGNGTVALNVSASAADGEPPFDWAVVSAPSIDGPGREAPVGTLAGAGSFGWNATLDVEGPIPVDVLVVDADGQLVRCPVPEVGVPPLNATASAEEEGGGGLEVALTIEGGVPPYAIGWGDSSGGGGNRTAPAPGVVSWDVPAATSGVDRLVVRVVDALGDARLAFANVTVAFPRPVAAASTDGASLLLLGTVAVLATGVGVLMLRRRRHLPSPPPEPPDPVAVLREVIEPSDGVDRALVEMLAEERGLAPEVIGRTLERLKEEGTVRSDVGPDGEESLTWGAPGGS